MTPDRTALDRAVEYGAKLVRNYARDEGEILTPEEVAQRIAARACQPLVEALEAILADDDGPANSSESFVGTASLDAARAVLAAHREATK